MPDPTRTVLLPCARVTGRLRPSSVGAAALRCLLRASILAVAIAAVQAEPATAQSRADSAARTDRRDGQRDFDFEIGSWRTQLRRLDRPLSGSTNWISYDGTSEVRAVMAGRANLVELDVSGPAGRIEGVSLRLYDPAARQWSLHYASARGGVLTAPVIGEFRNGRGAFHGQDALNGRAILVRFVITPITADSVHFEQAYSDDGAKTWELNWVAIDTRVKTAPRR